MPIGPYSSKAQVREALADSYTALIQEDASRAYPAINLSADDMLRANWLDTRDELDSGREATADYRAAYDKWDSTRLQVAINAPNVLSSLWEDWAQEKAQGLAHYVELVTAAENGSDDFGDVGASMISAAKGFTVPEPWRLAALQGGADAALTVVDPQMLATSPMGQMMLAATGEAQRKIAEMVGSTLSGIGNAAASTIALAVPLVGAMVSSVIGLFQAFPDSDEGARALMANIAQRFGQGQWEVGAQLAACARAQPPRFLYAGGLRRLSLTYQALWMACCLRMDDFPTQAFWSKDSVNGNDPAAAWITTVLSQAKVAESDPRHIKLGANSKVAPNAWVRYWGEDTTAQYAMDGEATETMWQLALFRTMFANKRVATASLMCACIFLTRRNPEENGSFDWPSEYGPGVWNYGWRYFHMGYPNPMLSVEASDEGSPGSVPAATKTARSSVELALELYKQCRYLLDL